jgi:hypothetical protein
MDADRKRRTKMSQPIRFSEAKLPYPTRPLEVLGGVVEEYIIPADKKAEVLNQLYPFEPVPGLDEAYFDIHEGKKFRIREFRVTWEGGMNFLVSPYYPSSGGTVIDWMPVNFANKRRSRGKRKNNR